MMKFHIAAITFVLVIYCLKVANGVDSGKKATNCDESIVQILCANFLTEAGECAVLMPTDEQQLFFECAQDLGISTLENWPEILASVCSQASPAQVSYDMISCWDDKRNATLDKIQIDNIYPYEHFKCKRKIFQLTMEQASCECKLRNGYLCNPLPPLSIPKIG